MSDGFADAGGLHEKDQEIEIFDDEFHPVMVTAAEARNHLAALEAESALAQTTELGGDGTYMQDLYYELAVWRHHYVSAAVTEIATLRAELSGANAG